jgi:hypothetical protein
MNISDLSPDSRSSGALKINTEGIKLMDVFVAMEKEFVAGIHHFYGSI